MPFSPGLAQQQSATVSPYNAPQYAPQPVRPASQKNRGLVIAMVIAGAVIVIAAAVLTIVLTRKPANNTVRSQNSGYSETRDRSDDSRETATPDRGAVSASASATAAAPSAAAPDPEPEPEPDIFPVVYSAFGNNYSITGYETGKASDGTTTVTIFGAGYSILAIRNGQLRVPAWASIYTSGAERSSTGCSTAEDKMTFSFNVSAEPEKIVVKNGDTNDIIAEINISSSSMSGQGASQTVEGSGNAAQGQGYGGLQFYPARNPNERGNTSGNIQNNGIAAEKDGWVYYANQEGLNRSRADGTSNTLLSRKDYMNVGYINVVGDWVYYIDINVDHVNMTCNSVLYRIRTDGTEKARLTDRHCEYLNVVGDWVYFTTYSSAELHPEKMFEFGIYQIRTDGAEETLIQYGNCTGVNVEGDWIYYIHNGDLYRIRTDGTGIVQLSYDSRISSYFVSGNLVYFSDFFEDNSIFKMNTDGTGRIKLSGEYSAFLNIYNDWVYYSDFQFINDEFDSGIYKMREDGTGKTLVCYAKALSLNIAGGSIYCIDINNDGFTIISTTSTGTPPGASAPVATIPIEYIGQWEGTVDNIWLEFTIYPDGTGIYTFEQSGYYESYDFTLEVGAQTFSVQVPRNNTLGISKIEGAYSYSESTGLLTLDILTTFSNGSVFGYTVPCWRA
jgi:hypothetical protein